MLTRGRNRKEAEVGQVGGIPGPKTKKACKNRLLTFAIWWWRLTKSTFNQLIFIGYMNLKLHIYPHLYPLGASANIFDYALIPVLWLPEITG
jgi:hypothetical protein